MNTTQVEQMLSMVFGEDLKLVFVEPHVICAVIDGEAGMPQLQAVHQELLSKSYVVYVDEGALVIEWYFPQRDLVREEDPFDFTYDR